MAMEEESYVPSKEFLWDVFKQVDKDRSGQISVSELQQALSNGSWNPFNEETCRQMIRIFDTEKKGTISFQDFGALWKYVVEWKNCFLIFDKDESGYIDKHEMLTALQAFGYRLSIETVTNMLRKFVKEGELNVYFDDFILCCVQLQNLTGSFRKLDTKQEGVITVHFEQFVNLFFDTGV